MRLKSTLAFDVYFYFIPSNSFRSPILSMPSFDYADPCERSAFVRPEYGGGYGIITVVSFA